MFGLGQEGLREDGRNCVKYVKREWNRKKGRGKKNFKKRGQAASRGGCLKKRRGGGGGWNPMIGDLCPEVLI